jgi:hypothetical protein
MVEFAETAMRHYCRNPKCRSKLKTPVSNSREAFCSDTTCKQRFYRLRCYVCGEKKKGRLDAHTCGRRKCKNAIRSLVPAVLRQVSKPQQIEALTLSGA